MPRLEIRLFGPFQVTLDGEPVAAFESNKVRALLAYLAAEAPRPQRRERLAGLLWPGWPQRSAMSNLRYALADLRKNLGDREAQPPFLHISRESLQFNRESDAWVDAAEFEQLAISYQPSAISHPQSQIENQKSTIALVRGDFLEGFSLHDSPEFEEWVLAKREFYKRQALKVLHELAEGAAQAGETELALACARRQLELEPWLEEAHRQVMRLLALSGQRSAALAQYEACRRALKDELSIEPVEETVQLYEQIRGGALSAPPPLPSFLRAGAQRAPEASSFVARQAELARMQAALALALDGKGQVVFVTGSPGRGKTSLAQEFTRQALQAHPGLVAASGNCQAYFGKGDPYLPFREVLAMLTGEVEDRWEAGAITHTHAARLWQLMPRALQALVEEGPALVDTFLPGASLVQRAAQATGDRPAWLPRLQEIVQARQKSTPSPAAGQEDLIYQYSRLLRKLAGQAPLLLFLDDMQWADPGSLSLLFSLGRQIAGSRILILGAYRPEEVLPDRAGSPHPLAALLAEFQLRYGDLIVDLDEAEGRLFVEAIVDREPNHLGAPFRELLFQQTGGHALFTIELLRGMQARGDLWKNASGEWEAAAEIRWEVLPARVEAAVAQRIQRLPAALRDVLQTASVEGETFTVEAAAELHGMSVPALLKALGEELDRRHQLVRAEGLVHILGRRLSRYRFRHILFQRYLYTTLDPLMRASLHEQVGEALERLYGAQAGEAAGQPAGQLAGQLARHFEEAGLPEKALGYLTQAGERAAEVAANQEAIDYFTRALDLTPAGDRAGRFQLLLVRWKVHNRTGQRQAEEKDLQALERLAESLGAAYQARAAICRAHFAEKFYDLDALSKTIPAAIAWAQASGEVDIEAEACIFSTHLFAEPAARDANYERGLRLARQAGLKGLEADILRDMCRDESHAGETGHGEQALQLYRSLGDRYGEGRALNVLAEAYESRGDFAAALSYAEEARQICREMGNRFDELFSVTNMAWARLVLGQTEGLVGILNEALEMVLELTFANLIIILLNLLSLAYRLQGDAAQALSFAQREREFFNPHLWSPLGEGFTLFDEGCALRALDRRDESAAAFQQGAEILSSSARPGDRDYLLLHQSALASLALAQGDAAQALGYVELIWPLHFTTFHNGHQYYVGWCYLTCCQVFQANADPRFPAALEEAYTVLQERAARISDETLRRSFLENIPEHQEIVALWQAAQEE